MMKFPEHYRVQLPRPCPQTKPHDPYGRFVIHESEGCRPLKVIASDGDNTGWEHVSVSLLRTTKDNPETPTWYEMCIVKDLFWDDTDTAVQYHPPKADHINHHSGVLHLWVRRGKGNFPMPPKWMV